MSGCHHAGFVDMSDVEKELFCCIYQYLKWSVDFKEGWYTFSMQVKRKGDDFIALSPSLVQMENPMMDKKEFLEYKILKEIK